MVKMNNVKYHIENIGKKLLTLKANKRLRKSDKQVIDDVLDDDIPAIQKLLKQSKNER